MTLHFNTQIIIVCVFYFSLSLFIAHMIKDSGFFLKTIFLLLFFGILGEVSEGYRIEVLISCTIAFLYVFTDSIVNFFSLIRDGIEEIFSGISYRVRLIASLIGKILYAVRWVLRLVLIPIANLFTWFYNLLSRTFRWNRVFIPLTEQFRRKSREAEPRRAQNESKKSGTDTTGSAHDREQEEYIRQAKEKVRQAREEAERKKREEEQQNTTGGDQRTPRQILGLSDTFTLEELKKAYKQAAFRYHPDKYAHMSETFQKEAQAEFVKAKNAYDVLMKSCQ
jgi:hypothetical protein